MYLFDIVRSAREILAATAEMDFDTYTADRLFRLAMERLFVIIGEALNQMSQIDPETASRISSRREVIGFRNFLIHRYSDVDDEEVWRIIVDRLPTLYREATELLRECEDT